MYFVITPISLNFEVKFFWIVITETRLAHEDYLPKDKGKIY